MADDQNDIWGSLASAVIPAAAGLIFGGRNRGAAAAYGAASGLENYYDDRQRTQNQADVRENRKRQLDLEERRLTAEEKRWATLDKQAEQAAELHGLNMEKAKLELEQIKKSKIAMDAYREKLPEETRSAFDLDPEAYIKREVVEKPQREGLGKMLESLGIKGGAEYAKNANLNHVSSLIEGIAKSRYETRAAHGQYVDGIGYVVFDPNKQSAKVIEIPGADKLKKQENYVRVRKQMFDEWVKVRKDNPEFFTKTPEELDNAFDEYFTSDSGVNKFKLLSKQQGIDTYVEKDKKAKDDKAAAQEPKTIGGRTTFDQMPKAADYNGRTLTDQTTGKKYKSDGKKWNPL